MRPIPVRTAFLTLSLVAIAASGSGVLTACSTVPSSQVQTPSPTAANVSAEKNTSHGGGMHHGSGMNHSMAMDLGPADANYDLRFIDAMTPHHQGAVSMAKQAQQKSQRPEIKKLADDIIKAQNKEISQLKQWRKAWYPQASSTPMAHNPQTGQMMPMSQEQMQAMMMEEDLGAADAQFNLRFINAMIPHHQGAVAMAQDAQKKSKRPEIKKLAQDIINSQNAEIEQMKKWRQAWYKQ